MSETRKYEYSAERSKWSLTKKCILLGNVTAGWTNSVAVIHDSGWLIIDYFAIVVSFPRAFIFLELWWPGKKRGRGALSYRSVESTFITMFNENSKMGESKRTVKRERGLQKVKNVIVRRAHLLQGSTHSPQHFSIPARLLSASFMSALIWSMPSSIRSSCSVFFH